MEQRIILFYILLFSNAVYLEENRTCDKQDVKSYVGRLVCSNYNYNRKSACRSEYPIIRKIISCSNMSMTNNTSSVDIESDGTIPITLNVTNSDITILSTSIFKNIKNLTILSLENSNIQKIIPGAFNFLDDMKELYLDGNQLKTISDGLFNSLTSLKKLDLSRNQIQDISNHAFQGIKLIELHLHHNNISQIGQELLDSLKSLKTLDMSWNLFNNISNFSVVPLTSLNLSHNAIEVVNFEFFSENITKIDLSFNYISKIINFKAIRAYGIILNHNNIRNLEKNINVEVLDVSYNELETLDSDIFGGSLKKLNAGYNTISSLNKKAFLGLYSLTYLLLNNNNLSFIPNPCFKDLRSLIYLDLSSNKLSHFEFGTFENLVNLKVLNISSNNFKDLQQYTFYSLNNLTHLFFQNNEIREMRVDHLMIYSPKLRTVNLNNNNWPCKKLLAIVHSFKRQKVSFPYGNSWEESNIRGIKCYESLNLTAVDKHDKSDIDMGYSRLNGFFNENFTKSSMYKYFNRDFKDSNFFKYLENLSNTQNVNVGFIEKLINELKFNYSDANHKILEQSAMYNYFNDDFRKSNFFKYLESLNYQARIENKSNDNKLEEREIRSFKEMIEKNSKLHNFNNSIKDFSKNDMYTYFNNDFKNSNFFKYLEGLNERIIAPKHTENFKDNKVEKYVSSPEEKGNSYYTGLLVFIATMLAINTSVIIVVAYLLIKKCSSPKKEELQLI